MYIDIFITIRESNKIFNHQWTTHVVRRTMSNYKRTNGEQVFPVTAYLTEKEKLRFKTHCVSNQVTMSNYIKNLILGKLNESRTS